MNMPTNIQIINGPGGEPAFVVIPYTDYVASRNTEKSMIPHDVISRSVDGATPVRAWREHLGLTQADVAERLGISQSAYAQQESSSRLRKASREKIAAALGIEAAQLDFEASRKDAQPNRSCVPLMTGVMNLRIHGVRVERELPLIP